MKNLSHQRTINIKNIYTKKFYSDAQNFNKILLLRTKYQLNFNNLIAFNKVITLRSLSSPLFLITLNCTLEVNHLYLLRISLSIELQGYNYYLINRVTLIIISSYNGIKKGKIPEKTGHVTFFIVL